MSELRLGLIGLGSAGSRRLAAAAANPRVRVVAACDPAVSFAGVAEPDSAALLAREDLDAVVIAVPNPLAADLTRKALRRGLHVLVEKPPARSAVEFRLGLADRGDRVLRIGFNHRLHYSLQAAKALVEGGALGRLVRAEGCYERPWLARPGDWRADPSAGGGILLDQGIHLVDAARWLLGPLTLRHHRVVGAPMEVSVEATLDAGGVPLELASRAGAEGFRFFLELQGERGSLVLDGLQTSSGVYAPERLLLDGAAPRTWTHDPSCAGEIDGFVRHVLDGDDDGHGCPADALAVLELVDRMRAPAAAEAA